MSAKITASADGTYGSLGVGANEAFRFGADNSGQLAGFRNKIINGGMQVAQRGNAGAAQTITAGAALAYTVDRWYAYCTGANVTGQQITTNGSARYRFTGATSNTGVGFGTRLEAANVYDLVSKSCKLQVKLASSSLTSITWTAYYANTADTFGTLASPTRTQIATGTFTITSTEATYTADISVSAGAYTGIEIVFTGGALLGSQTLTIGDVQFEQGTIATPFEHRPYGTEFLLCQRYTVVLKGYCLAAQGYGLYEDVNTIYYIIPGFNKQCMRDTITLTMVGVQGTDWAVQSSAGVNQTGFTMSFDGNIIVGSKTSHGLTQSNLSTLTASGAAVLSSEL